MISLLKILKINEIIHKKWSGKAMFYALFLTLIFTILSSVVLLSFFSFENAHFDYQEAKNRVKHLNSGINWILAQGDKEVEKKQISLLGEDWLPIEVLKSEWGLLEIGSVRAMDTTLSRVDTIQRTFFIGNVEGESMKKALYLSDSGKPLKLAGQSGIIGNAQIPKAGVEAGFVEGTGFSGQQLVDGQIAKSFQNLPSIKVDKIKALFQSGFKELPLEYLTDNDIYIENSFAATTLKLALSNEQIASISLKGNIVIWSTTPLYLAKSCQLEDVIIFAPKITFANGFKGSLQAYATQEIIVEEQVELSDPSVLGVLTNTQSNDISCQIQVKRNASISGLVFLLNRHYSRKEHAIVLAENAKLQGQLVCDGNLHHAGEINGNATVKKFRLKTNAAIYDNFILDGRLINDNTKYCVPNIFNNQSVKKGVIKWCS